MSLKASSLPSFPLSFRSPLFSYQAIVKVKGTSLTNEREHDSHPTPSTLFTTVPDAIVTDVGAVAEYNGIVKSCEISWLRVQQELQPQGM